MAWADFQRSRGCFCRALSKTRSSPSGASGRKARNGTGGCWRIISYEPGLARVEAQVGILVRQQEKQRRGGAIDVGGLADIAELADVIGRNKADRAADVALARQVVKASVLGEALGQPEIGQLDAGPVHRAPSPAGFDGFTSRWTYPLNERIRAPTASDGRSGRRWRSATAFPAP